VGYLVVVGIPAVVAALVVLLPRWRSTRRAALVASALGMALSVAFVAVAYLTSPTYHDPVCEECGLHWGRYWEPFVVVLVTLYGLGAWLASTIVVAGLQARSRTRARNRGDGRPPPPRRS
jgi:hypothetical protein